MARGLVSLLLVLAAALGMVSAVPLSANSKTALDALISATNGGSWTVKLDTTSATFCTDQPDRVTCDGQGEIRTLKLASNNLVGVIPTEIGLLTVMTYLTLAGNDLSGVIPTELGNCAQLAFFSLADNELQGNVPTEIAQLPIAKLVIHGNKLSGAFPAVIAQMPSLTHFHMFDNDFTSLPATTYGANIQVIRFENNKLTSIPKEIFTPTLTNVRLQFNQITGSIPTEIGLATNLLELFVHNNQLTGSIPTQIGNTAISRLWAANNQISGSLPTELGNTDILEIRMNNNQLTGGIPSQLGASPLQFLNLGLNKMFGAIPSQLFDGDLHTMLLEKNFFYGQLPFQLVESTVLSNIRLTNNCISPKTDYSDIPTNDFAGFSRSLACTPANMGGKFPPFTTEVDGDGSINIVVGKYQFSQGSFLLDSSTSGNNLIQNPSVTVLPAAIDQIYNPLNTGALVPSPFSDWALRSTSPFPAASFTIEMLFSMPSVSSGQQLFAFAAADGSSEIFHVELQSNGFLHFVHSSGSVASTEAILPDRMVHVVLARNAVSNNVRWYINGVARGNVNPISLSTGDRYLHVAKNTAIAIDELYIYNFVLSAAQIAARATKLEWCSGTCSGTCTATVNGNVCA